MAIYFTVLKSDKKKGYWKAVQNAKTLPELRAKKKYRAGVSMSIPKGGETYIEEKTVIEEVTLLPAKAEVYRLDTGMTSAINRLFV